MIERPGWPGLIASLCLAVVVCLWPGPAAPADTTARAPAFEVRENADRIVLRFGARPVLAYHKSAVPPPKGADPAYRRSGFIHPLHTPSGAVVTGIHPPDHVHHFGLWHAWVKSRHAGRQLDFWNLKKKQATVRFARTVQVVSTLKGAGFTVEQEHVDLTRRPPRVILRDVFQVAVEKRGEAYLVDYVSKQTNVTDAALELPAYRYGGGIAFRGPSTWKHPTGQYLSSAGRTRADGHQTRSRWCAMSGPAGRGTATVAILSHRANHDSPQRMRVWDKQPWVFFNYVPTQEKHWQIRPGETATMRYRLVVQDGKADAGTLDALWRDYVGRATGARPDLHPSAGG